MSNVVAMKPETSPRVMTVSQLFDAVSEGRKAGWLDDVITAIDETDTEATEKAEAAGDDPPAPIQWTDERRDALRNGLWWALQLIGVAGMPERGGEWPAVWPPITVVEDPEEKCSEATGRKCPAFLGGCDAA